MNIMELQKPLKIKINPFGKSDDDVDNIFIVDADGFTVATINKHPVWKHCQSHRLKWAQQIIDAFNAS